MGYFFGLLLASGVLFGQPTPQATADRFFDRVSPLTQSLRSVRLTTNIGEAIADLPRSLAADRFEFKPHESGGDLRVGAAKIPIAQARWWKRIEPPDASAWIDIIELNDESAAAGIPPQWRQSHTGTTYPDAFAFITVRVTNGLDALGAIAVRGRDVINLGVALPFRVRLWEDPTNSVEELAAIDAAVDRLARMIEATIKAVKDPAFLTWIPPAIPTGDVVRMRRVASFARLWSEVKYNFVFLNERKDLDWESMLEMYLPRIMAAQSDEEYAQAMKETMALLKDGHTSIQAGGAVDQPPVRIEPVEGRAVLTGIADVPELRSSGLRLGMELVSVDGTRVAELQKKYDLVAAASTPQNRADIVDWMLLQGPPNSATTVVFRDADGTTLSATLKRNQGQTPAQSLPWRKPPFEYRELSGNIAYVALNTFGSDLVVKRFDEYFDRIRKAAGLIIDVRENGGGSSENGYGIVARLIEKGTKLKGSTWRTRDYQPALRAWGQPEGWHEGTPDEIEAHGETWYAGPVVVLMGSNTFSAAEDFLVPLKMSKRATLVGTPSAGSTGQPLIVPLYQATARICTKWDRFADGTEFVGVGVQPDVLVERTIADVAGGRDPIMEKALEILNSSKK
jgi:C-terminal processing protease CtpA/Prc